jgi:hypothetical protein
VGGEGDTQRGKVRTMKGSSVDPLIDKVPLGQDGHTQVSHVTLRSFRPGTSLKGSSSFKRAKMETFDLGSSHLQFLSVHLPIFPSFISLPSFLIP